MKNIVFSILLCTTLIGCTCSHSAEPPKPKLDASTITLPAEGQNAMKTLKQNGTLNWYEGSERIVQINPDYWYMLSSQDREAHCMVLTVYINKYVLRNTDVESWWIQIESKATKKKLAKFVMGWGYTEFSN